MKESTFISATWGNFSKTDYILGHKASLSTYGKTELTLCTLSDHQILKLYRKNNTYGNKYLNSWKLIKLLYNEYLLNKEINKNI